jgi:hypothetical protein
MQSRGGTAGSTNYGVLGSLGSVGSPQGPMSMPGTTKNRKGGSHVAGS